MSEVQRKTYLEAIQANAGLQGKRKAEASPGAVVAIANAPGFETSADELRKCRRANSDGEIELSDELSDEELEGVAGGAKTPDNIEHPVLKLKHPV